MRSQESDKDVNEAMADLSKKVFMKLYTRCGSVKSNSLVALKVSLSACLIEMGVKEQMKLDLSRQSADEGELLSVDDTSPLKRSFFDPLVPTKMIVHGWLSGESNNTGGSLLKDGEWGCAALRAETTRRTSNGHWVK